MRVTVTPARLAAILAVAGKATGKAAVNPVLPMVLLEATPDGGLAATGTDLRTRAWRTAEAMVETPGAVCLPPGALSDFLDVVPLDGTVDIAVDAASKATLSAGRTVVRVAGLPADEFPAGPDLSSVAASMALPADVLVSLVKATAYAASADDARPALSCVNLVVADAVLTATAADGLRLARRRVQLAEPTPPLDIMVPARALAAVAEGLGDSKEPVRLSLDAGGQRLVVDGENGTWSLLLGEGRYPDVTRMVEQPVVAAYTCARADLQRACKLVAGVLVAITSVDGKTSQRDTKAVLEPCADGLLVRAGDVAADHMAETVLAAQATGEVYTVAVNGGALRDAAESLSGQVVVELCGQGRSVYLRNAGPVGPLGRTEHLAMIQPMAVANANQRQP